MPQHYFTRVSTLKHPCLTITQKRRPVGAGDVGGAKAPIDFDRSVSRLKKGGGQIIPTDLLLPPRFLDPPTALVCMYSQQIHSVKGIFVSFASEGAAASIFSTVFFKVAGTLQMWENSLVRSSQHVPSLLGHLLNVKILYTVRSYAV